MIRSENGLGAQASLPAIQYAFSSVANTFGFGVLSQVYGAKPSL